jgi:hypothetical protein
MGLLFVVMTHNCLFVKVSGIKLVAALQMVLGQIHHNIRLAFVVPSYNGTTNVNLIILWVMDSTRHDKLGGYMYIYVCMYVCMWGQNLKGVLGNMTSHHG